MSSTSKTSQATASKVPRFPGRLPMVQRLSQPCPDEKDEALRHSRALFCHGGSYLLKMALLFLRRAYDNGCMMFLGWPTLPGVPANLNDILFFAQRPTASDQKYRWVQFKLRTLDDAPEMTAADFLQPNGRLSLHSYYNQHLHLRSRELSPNWKTLDRYLILVQHKVSLESLRAAGIVLRKMTTRDLMFDAIPTKAEVPTLITKAEVPTLNIYSIHSLPASFLQHLRQGLEVTQLAYIVAGHVLSGQPLTLDVAVIQKYHHALVTEGVVTVVNPGKTAKLHPDFVARKFTSGRCACFYRVFAEVFRQLDPAGTQWSTVERREFPVADGFGVKQPSSLSTLPADEDPTLKQFRSKLFLVFDLPNEAELGRIMTKELGAGFGLVDGNIVFERFWPWLQTLTQQQADHCLTQIAGQGLLAIMLQKLRELMLTGVFADGLYRKQALEGHLKFSQAHLEPLADALDGSKLVRLNTTCPAVTSLKVGQLLRWRHENDYAILDSHRLLALREFATVATRLHRSYWLVVEMRPASAEDSVQVAMALCQVIKEVQFESWSDKKLVLITEDQNAATDMVLHDKPHLVRHDADMDFEGLDQVSTKLLLDCPVLFQNEPMRLGDLLGDAGNPAVFDPRLLNRILTGEVVRFGRALRLGDLRRTLRYYVPRRMQVYRRFNRQVLSTLSSTKDQLLFLTGVTLRDIQRWLPENQVCSFEDWCSILLAPEVKVIVFKDPNQVDQLQAKLPNRTIQWWHVTDQFYKLISPRGDGTCSEPSGPVVKLLTGTPGMGKSVALCNLALTEKRHKPGCWVLQVNLADFAEQLMATRFDDLPAVLDFLSVANGLKETYERKWLDYCVAESGRVLVFLDGFDKLERSAQANVTHLIRLLKSTRVEAIWVSTLRCPKHVLETKEADMRYDLMPLTRLHQQAIIAGYWLAQLSPFKSASRSKRLAAYAKQFMLESSSALRCRHQQLMNWLERPLLAQMVAEVYWQDVQTSLTSEDDAERLQVLTVLPDRQRELFDEYAKSKIMRGLSRHFDSDTYVQLRTEFAALHGHLAILQLFGDVAKKCGFPEETPEGKEKETLLGMQMVFVGSGGQLRFDSSLLARYFFIHRLTELTQHSVSRRSLIIPFLKKVYFDESFDPYRLPLEEALAKGSTGTLFEAILNDTCDRVVKMDAADPGLMDQTDKLGRTPLHLAVWYMPKAVLQLLEERNIDRLSTIDDLGFTPLCYALLLMERPPWHGDIILSLALQLSNDAIADFLALVVPLIEQRHGNRHSVIAALNCLLSDEQLTVVTDCLDWTKFVRDSEYCFDELRHLLDVMPKTKYREILAVDGYKVLKRAVCNQSSSFFEWIAEHLNGDTLRIVEDAVLQETNVADRFADLVKNRDFASVMVLMRPLTQGLRRELWRRTDYRQVFQIGLAAQEVHLVAELLGLFETEELFTTTDCLKFFADLLHSPYRDCYFVWMLDHIASPRERSKVLVSVDIRKAFHVALQDCDRGMLSCLANLKDYERASMRKSVCYDDCQPVFRHCLERRDDAMLQLLLRFVDDAEEQCVKTHLSVEVEGSLSFTLRPEVDDMSIAQICDDLDDYRHQEYDWSIWGHLVYALLRLQLRNQT